MKPQNWYNETTEFLQATFGTDYQLVAGLLAATSPQVRLQTSWAWTIQIYHQFKRGEHPNLSMFMRCHKANVLRALAGEPLQGRKVRAFYAALCGDDNAVVLDMWMLRLFKYYPRHTHNPQGKRYDRLADVFRSVAKYNNIAPAELQAILWTEYRQQNGMKPTSYCIAGRDTRQMEFDFDESDKDFLPF